VRGLAVARAEATAAAFLAAYQPAQAVVRRIPAHAAVARIRLACLYAFRPRQAGCAAQLVTASAARDSILTLTA